MSEKTSVKPKDLEGAKKLMKQHEEEARVELDEHFRQQVPAHTIYFLGVVVGAFVLNLLVLILITGG